MDRQAKSSEEQWLGQFIPLHYHFHMLQDEHRVHAFRRAIETHVRPGMNVLELGGGTGILSYFAARQGGRVFCVERNPALAKTARQLALRNHVESNLSVIQADAMDYLPPVRIDAVICEMLHSGLLREKQLQVLAAFKERYLRSGFDNLPIFIPNATMLAVELVEFCFDFAGYQAPLPLFLSPYGPSERMRGLSAARCYHEIYYEQEYCQQFEWSNLIDVSHSGQLTALKFITQNLVNYAPNSATAEFWPNQYLVLPVQPAVAVTPGDRVEVSLNYQAGAAIEDLAASLRVQVHRTPDIKVA